MATSVALSSSSGSIFGSIARGAEAAEEQRGRDAENEEPFFGRRVFGVDLDGAASSVAKDLCDALICFPGGIHAGAANARLNARRVAVVAAWEKGASRVFLLREIVSAASLHSSPKFRDFFVFPTLVSSLTCRSPCVPLLSRRLRPRRELVRMTRSSPRRGGRR